ncbi:MAG: ferrochelatase [Paenibacillaceae bacterium]|uniref:Coproporphyrin III ferrochelatase n=1 Tax=Paenibacillus mellifer TaxID=2937794 RepID=A0A9X2BRV4_9BACL|nr:ferrochelatase [Paenibacillus mellifer]MBW4838178.1 ferrochelatase [Paenibacillaceae bacterium]MCK8489843.1 ferrochelatase [Paenibacillus mellifer]
MKSKIGVLVMSYGTPQSLDQVEAYYTHIRRGHPPTAEQLQELVGRYEAIVGGVFPLRANTDKQVAALQDTLHGMTADQDVEFVCYQGLKHAHPFIEDGVAQMAEDGIREAVGIVLAPHYSVMSIGGYIKRAEAKAQELGVTMRFVESYHLHPKLIEALAARVSAKLDQFEEAGALRDQVRVLFSAHSLPEKILQMGDPYRDQLLETSQAVADKVGVINWQFTWQSAGRTADPWLGPDILDTLKDLSEEQVEDVLVAPVGFVSDHLEVLYDLDIEAKTIAKELDMRLERIESLNTEPLYMEALGDVIIKSWEKR